MPSYSQTTLDDFTTQLSQILDDPAQVYWTLPELQWATREAMYVWGSLTNYWRARGTFNTRINTVGNQGNSPYYTLPVQAVPLLRPRNTTLNQMVTEIEYMLLESPSGITGAGFSGQVSILSILQAVQRAVNRFIIDTKFLASVSIVLTPGPFPDGLVDFSVPPPSLLSTVFIHSLEWFATISGTYTPLWRQDAWETDHDMSTFQPGIPVCYSESQLSPLQLQLSPVPSSDGTLRSVQARSIALNFTNPISILPLPNEWIYAVKYAALADLLGADSQLNDPMRAQYANMRYGQAVAAAKDARSIMRLTIGGVPIPIDSMAALDAAQPYWRNQIGPPQTAGVTYDMLAFSPLPDQAYGVSIDVVQAAPVPLVGTDFIQVGFEDIPHLLDYCTHVLLFKCGGNEFKSSFSDYDDFMKAVEMRGAINRAKITYLDAEFGQPQKDQRERPDAREMAKR